MAVKRSSTPAVRHAVDEPRSRSCSVKASWWRAKLPTDQMAKTTAAARRMRLLLAIIAIQSNYRGTCSLHQDSVFKSIPDYSYIISYLFIYRLVWWSLSILLPLLFPLLSLLSTKTSFDQRRSRRPTQSSRRPRPIGRSPVSSGGGRLLRRRTPRFPYYFSSRRSGP